MKNLTSWLISIFLVMFWVSRLILSFMFAMGYEDIPFKPIDLTSEIIVLFVSLIGILFALKRKLIGGILILVTYVYYFGLSAFQGVMAAINNPSNINGYSDALLYAFAILLAIGLVFDLLVNKDRHELKDNKDTHWFYKNSKYDRKLDERADKNQYRINN